MTTNSFASAFTKPWQLNNPVIPEDHEKSNLKYGRLVPALKTGFPVFNKYIGFTPEPDIFESPFEYMPFKLFSDTLISKSKYAGMAYLDIGDDDFDLTIHEIMTTSNRFRTGEKLTPTEKKDFKIALNDFNTKYGKPSVAELKNKSLRQAIITIDANSGFDKHNFSEASWQTWIAERDKIIHDTALSDEEKIATYKRLCGQMKTLILSFAADGGSSSDETVRDYSDDDYSEDEWDEDDEGDESIKQALAKVKADEAVKSIDAFKQKAGDKKAKAKKKEEDENKEAEDFPTQQQDAVKLAEANDKKAEAEIKADAEIKAITAVYNSTTQFTDLTTGIKIDEALLDDDDGILDGDLEKFAIEMDQSSEGAKTGKYGRTIDKVAYIQMGKDLNNIIDRYVPGDYDKDTVKILLKFAIKYKETWDWNNASAVGKRDQIIKSMLELWKLNKFNKTG